ncbi:MAG: protein jag [Selenomonas sp.]|jgi:spoIIIJ-associated protein|nr:protein jag [Selenomonas sp.]
MADVVETTGKTVEAALAAALAQLGTTEDKVSYEVLAQPSNGFLGLIGVKPARIRVTCKPVDPAQPAAVEVEKVQQDQPQTAQSDSDERPAAVDAAAQISRAEKFLRDVFAAMRINLTLNCSETEEGTVFNLVGEDLGILIGKHGQTLDSLQYLTNLAANRGISDGRVRIIIDIENYRSRREETLTRLAGHLAEKACRIGDEVHLEPMNRHERKIIHMALQDNRRVTTFSAGDEPRRYVVIAPKRRRSRKRDYERFDEE